MNKLWIQIQANLKYNDKFKTFCKEQGVLRTGFYGQEEVCNEKETVKAFKATSKIWYKDYFEAYRSIDAMPFGGWKTEKEELTFLRAFRKINANSNSEVRAFMRKWTGDSDWDF